jgi:nitrogen fixation-related uncharacterized protein
MMTLIVMLVIGFFVGLAAMWFLIKKGQVTQPKGK